MKNIVLNLQAFVHHANIFIDILAQNTYGKKILNMCKNNPKMSTAFS